MKKRFWALIVSIMVFIGAVPGLPVLADDDGNVSLNAGYGGSINIIDSDSEIIKSDEEGSFGSVCKVVEVDGTLEVEAKSDEGYCFIGWFRSPTPDSEAADNLVSTDNRITISKTSETVDTVEEYYALFRELITVTFHLGTVDDQDVLDPVLVKATPGSLFGEIASDEKYITADTELANTYGSTSEWMERTTYRPLKEIASEGNYKETDVVDINDRFWENTDIYVSYMIPITSVNVTLEPPIAGKTNETIPVITVPEGANYGSKSIIGEPFTPYWFDPENTDEAYDVTFECGKTYYARFFLEAKIGYYFELSEDGVTVNNSKPYSVDEQGNVTWWMEAAVTLDHDWGEWEITTQATTTTPGTMTRTCSACNHTEEKEYTLETASTTDNNTAAQPVERDSVTDVPDGTYKPTSHVSGVRIVDGILQVWNGEEWIDQADSIEGFAHFEGADAFDDFSGAEIINNATNSKSILRRDGNSLINDATGKVVGGLRIGSLIIDLYPDYLKTLDAGEYTLTANFNDSESVSITFTVFAAATTPAADTTKAGTAVPSTGEAISSTMIWGAVLVSLSVISIGVVLDKKRLGKKDVK